MIQATHRIANNDCFCLKASFFCWLIHLSAYLSANLELANRYPVFLIAQGTHYHLNALRYVFQDVAFP